MQNKNNNTTVTIFADQTPIRKPTLFRRMLTWIRGENASEVPFRSFAGLSESFRCKVEWKAMLEEQDRQNTSFEASKEEAEEKLFTAIHSALARGEFEEAPACNENDLWIEIKVTEELIITLVRERFEYKLLSNYESLAPLLKNTEKISEVYRQYCDADASRKERLEKELLGEAIFTVRRMGL